MVITVSKRKHELGFLIEAFVSENQIPYFRRVYFTEHFANKAINQLLKKTEPEDYYTKGKNYYGN